MLNKPAVTLTILICYCYRFVELVPSGNKLSIVIEASDEFSTV